MVLLYLNILGLRKIKLDSFKSLFWSIPKLSIKVKMSLCLLHNKEEAGYLNLS